MANAMKAVTAANTTPVAWLVRTRRHQKNSSEKPSAGRSRGPGVTTASGSAGTGGAGGGVRAGSGAVCVPADALGGFLSVGSRLRREARRGGVARSS